MRVRLALSAVTIASGLAARTASAMCSVYMPIAPTGPADVRSDALVNDAASVVLMRDGTRTVMS
ncbi:MAG: hypothetical protein ACHREM_24775, partial [Polyangiales bacterium]